MTNFLTATLALASSPLVVIGGIALVCAVGYCALVDQARRRDARTKAENERRRAIHPSGRELVTDFDREFARQNGVLL